MHDQAWALTDATALGAQRSQEGESNPPEAACDCGAQCRGRSCLLPNSVSADSIKNMTTKAEALRSKVSVSRAKADEAKASMAANRSENAVLSSLTKLKQQGRVKGFHVSYLGQCTC